jgi:hypothetical protein
MLVAPRVETACWPHAQRLELMAVEDKLLHAPRNLGQQTPVTERNISEGRTAQRVFVFRRKEIPT